MELGEEGGEATALEATGEGQSGLALALSPRYRPGGLLWQGFSFHRQVSNLFVAPARSVATGTKKGVGNSCWFCHVLCTALLQLFVLCNTS